MIASKSTALRNKRRKLLAMGAGVALAGALPACKTLPQQPVAGPGKPLPDAGKPIDRILLGSCFDEETAEASAVFEQMARERADLLLLLGDNVYGDVAKSKYVRADASLTELRRSFDLLARRKDFQALRRAHPMMVAWDDHDFGRNDGGRDFAHKARAEKIHEHFWGLDAAVQVDGTYYAKHFGPADQRVQILMLDTRSFRSPLTRTDKRGARGRERYLPSTAKDQDMLGQAQWAWLQAQLREPAQVRLIASSIQVLPTSHGWEGWSRLPRERERLLDRVNSAPARATLFVSGDRHRAFIYRQPVAGAQPLLELTASSINRGSGRGRNESDPAQQGAAFSANNYGAIDIDWQAGELALAVHDETGKAVRRLAQSLR